MGFLLDTISHGDNGVERVEKENVLRARNMSDYVKNETMRDMGTPDRVVLGGLITILRRLELMKWSEAYIMRKSIRGLYVSDRIKHYES